MLEPASAVRLADGVLRPRKWRSYQSGNRVPQRRVGKPYAVAVAESRFTGTAAYFENPMWQLLKGEPLGVPEIDVALRDLSPDIDALLFEVAEPPEAGVFRPREFDGEAADRLVALASFAASCAAVLLMAKAELIASLPLRETAYSTYLALQPALAKTADVGMFSAPLFHFIDEGFKLWVFANNQFRLEVRVISERLPRPPAEDEM